MTKVEHPGIGMNAFKLYVKMILSPCYYRNITVSGKEYVPEAGTPVVFVGNHRNGMCDPLIVETLFTDRDIRWFVRADLFKNRLIGSILKALHLMPMYRMDFDGLETLLDRIKENVKSGVDELVAGHSIGVFPEARLMPGHYLGTFHTSYLQMAFECAAKNDFQTEVYIQPFGLYYEDYFNPGGGVLVNFCKPVRLSPYYEDYKNKPRTTMNRINGIIWDEVRSATLHIPDDEYYPLINQVRQSGFINSFADDIIGNMQIAERLRAEQELANKLHSYLEDNPEQYRYIIKPCADDINELKGKEHSYSQFRSTYQIAAAVILYPLLGLLPGVVLLILGYYCAGLAFILLWLPALSVAYRFIAVCIKAKERMAYLLPRDKSRRLNGQRTKLYSLLTSICKEE